MYEAYFGLAERPFSISPDPRYLYLSARHREALAHLTYGITVRGGFVQLTGEVGTGKTLLTRALLEQLPDNVDVALLLNPTLSPVEFLSGICEELGIELPARRHSVKAIVSALNRYLLEAYARGRQTVVLVDEAQNLSTHLIEQVRLLTNLETHREKLLQIILVGQPELRQLLQRPELRQVSQRITARYHLRPLHRRETRDYVRHRLTVAGAAQPLFTRPALRLLHRLSGGIPRLINVIADRALLGAYARSSSRATAATVLKAAREVRGEERSRWRSPAPYAALLLLAVGIASGLILPQALSPAPAEATAAAEPVPAVPSAPPPVEPAEPRPPDLAQALNRPALPTDVDSAFAALLARWGADYPLAGEDTPCERTEAAGLRCSYLNGSLESLLRLNLPAVIQLSDLRGQPHRLVVQRIEGERVWLGFGKQQQAFDRRELARAWPDEYLVVWRAPLEQAGLLRPGSRGPAVVWLRRQLDAAGIPGAGGAGERYDQALAERVRRFQRDHYLRIDGLTGENTLLHLVGAVGGEVPRLKD